MYQELSYIAWNSFLDEMESYDNKLSTSSIYVDFRVRTTLLEILPMWTNELLSAVCNLWNICCVFHS